MAIGPLLMLEKRVDALPGEHPGGARSISSAEADIVGESYSSIAGAPIAILAWWNDFTSAMWRC